MGTVLIAAGGTGGHVYPALALADELRGRGHSIVFAGGDRIESRLVPEAGYELVSLPARALPRRPSVAAVTAGLAFLRSLSGARRAIHRVGAQVVVGMGGYPSLAPSMVAGFSGVPVVLHEQNARLSLAHRLSLRRARTLVLSLPLVDGDARRPGLRTELLGNPLRAAVADLAGLPASERAARRASARQRLGLREDTLVLLAFGGSLGARALNQALPLASRRFEVEGVEVLHIAGPDHADGCREDWSQGGCPATVFGYVDAMEEAYAASDVVVSRSGASTVSELAAVGLPAVLVPFPHAPGDAQAANARVLEDAGAAVLVPEAGDDLAGRLAAALGPVLSDPARRERMASAARAQGRPDATGRIADLVERHIR